eukprot:6947047-Prymnesium_polylepis.1
MAPKRKARADATVHGDGGGVVVRRMPKMNDSTVTLGQMDLLFCERVQIYGRTEPTDNLCYCAAHGCFHPVTYFTRSEFEAEARYRKAVGAPSRRDLTRTCSGRW